MLQIDVRMFERVEVVEWNKRWSPLLSCESSVSVKENPDRKKESPLHAIYIFKQYFLALTFQSQKRYNITDIIKSLLYL